MTLKEAMIEMSNILSTCKINDVMQVHLSRNIGSLVFKRALATPIVAEETRVQVKDKLGNHYDDLVGISTTWYMRVISSLGTDTMFYHHVATAMLLDHDVNEPIPSIEDLARLLRNKPMFIAWYIISLSNYGGFNAAKSAR